MNDILLHTFEYTIIPKDYKEPTTQREEAIKYRIYTKPNYSKKYKNTAQIILNKLHIYKIKVSLYNSNYVILL